jgi:asparagine synthase (glutamine-hydrolysing)
MCGIAGIFHLSGKPASEREINKMAEALAHRGPDGSGVFVQNNVALGHRRLAILDTSELGKQPMASKDGQWMVTFNGCIYNFKELKERLYQKGHTFITQTDTEVISEGLSEYGVDFLEQLNGMFALGAWHSATRTLYLSRDRFGIKPLYYWFNGKTLLFASEIKAILVHPEYKIQLDLGALNEYFTFQNLFTYRTLFKDITMLPPANTVQVNIQSTSVQHRSWWDYDFSEPDEKMSFQDAREETLRLFEQAVKRQMIADVPVGSYLSGGMDSGSIAALASRHVDRLTTFTCGFDMSAVTGRESNFDERRDAELMANFLKTEHYEQVINAGDLRYSLPKVVYHIEDLRVGMSYPSYYISRLASRFVKVCLQGTGGDELFGGYPWRYYRVFSSISQNDFFNQYYGFWQRLVPDAQKKELFQPNVFKKIDLNDPREIFERVFTFNNKLKYETPEDHIQNSLYFEIKTFLNGLLLVGDKLSMANGLEERFPFLDNDLVAFAQKIPIKHKLGNLQKEISRLDENTEKKKAVYREYNDGKNVLRKAMEELMPENIINRKKQGFSAPDESWYRGENAAYVRELLLEGNNLSSEFINPKYIRNIVKEHTEQNINHRLLIWSFMNFECWCRVYLKNDLIP